MSTLSKHRTFFERQPGRQGKGKKKGREKGSEKGRENGRKTGSEKGRENGRKTDRQTCRKGDSQQGKCHIRSPMPKVTVKRALLPLLLPPKNVSWQSAA